MESLKYSASTQDSTPSLESPVCPEHRDAKLSPDSIYAMPYSFTAIPSAFILR